MLKSCRGCGEGKPFSDFYRNHRMPDGHLNSCKNCDKLERRRVAPYKQEKNREDAAKWRNANRDKIAKYKEKNKHKTKANKITSRAIASGELIREPCSNCGNEKSEAHHEDYRRYLDITWLCSSCHKDRHQEIRLDIQNGNSEFWNERGIT